jgi:hypothetical protein
MKFIRSTIVHANGSSLAKTKKISKLKKLANMKTINDYKSLLHANGQNTLLGMHLNSIIGNRYSPLDVKADLHDLELKIEVIAQLFKNGIDAFEDRYPLGSVTKAYYQYMLNQYNEF